MLEYTLYQNTLTVSPLPLPVNESSHLISLLLNMLMESESIHLALCYKIQKCEGYQLSVIMKIKALVEFENMC